MTASIAFPGRRDDGVRTETTSRLLQLLLRPLHVLMAAPVLLFLGALTAMLLRHPDVSFFEIDRIAFGLLVMGVLSRAVVQRRQLFVVERATWPMMALTLLAVASSVDKPFENEGWSLLAAKFIVPFALFHIAGLVFREQRSLRQFELFSLVVLAYLSFTAVAFLAGMRWLIFPRFILDESLGFQPDRARGPLLQAVANGVSLNLLGIVALHAYQRGLVRGLKMVVLLAAVPVAILATMTRAVWLSFIGTLLALVFVSRRAPCRRVCIALALVIVAGVAVVFSSSDFGGVLKDRLEESGPLNYREAVYAGGFQMFLERPVMGWGFHQMPAELPRFVVGYREKVLYPHNTYLELLVEHGIVGLGLYLWLMWELWRLGRSRIPPGEDVGFLDREFHRMWPILLGVYWLNAAVVVMSYQFVNAFLFTMAGMLAAQRRRAEAFDPC